MAASVQLVRREFVDIGEVRILDLLLDNAYPFGGYAFTAKELGFLVGSEVLAAEQAAPSGLSAVQVVKDGADHKVKIKAIRGDFAPNRLLDPAGLAIGTDKTRVLSAAFGMSHLGVNSVKASVETPFTATTDDIPADADKVQERSYLLSIDSAGTITVTPGAVADEDQSVPGSLPAGDAPMGVVKIKVAAGATPFDATSDDLDAAHLTTTFTDQNGEAVEGEDLSSIASIRSVLRGR